MKLYTSNVGSMSDEELDRLIAEIEEADVLVFDGEWPDDSWQDQACSRHEDMVDELRRRRPGLRVSQGEALATLDAYAREHIGPKLVDLMFGGSTLVERLARRGK